MSLVVAEMLPNPNAPRLLVVDQDLSRARRIGAMLEKNGYYVQNAYNVGDALFAVETSRFNAALVNVQMRDRDGTTIKDLWRTSVRASRVPYLDLSEFTLDQPGQEAALFNPLTQLLNSASSPVPGVSGGNGTAPNPFDSPPVAAPSTGADTNVQLRRDVAELQTLAALSQSVSSSLDLSE